MGYLLPGATLGVLGGGQLGLMFVNSARTMGYRSVVWQPSADSPAARVCDVHIKQDFTDEAACRYFARLCDAVTLEFENVPLQVLESLEEQGVAVMPSAHALRVAQDRIAEKTFIKDLGIATTPFYPLRCAADIDAAFEHLTPPVVLKTARLGYDGKGQRVVDTLDQARVAFEEMGRVPCVAESRLNLATEISVVLARSQKGKCEFFPVAENVHRNSILHLSHVSTYQVYSERYKLIFRSTHVNKSVQEQAREYARRIAEALAYQGVLSVEFFVVRPQTESSGVELFVNEIAPRPHNTGHYTLDACLSSQFDQQVRMMCGLPPAPTRLMTAAVMVNLLGDLWENGEPQWDILLKDPMVKLHLYGKQQPRRGRKMGHFCLLAKRPDSNIDKLLLYAEHYHSMLRSEKK